MPYPPRHAVLYVCHDRLRSGHVLDPLTRYAQARGHRIVARFADALSSGTPLAERAAWNEHVLPALAHNTVGLLVADAEAELAATDEERDALRLALLRAGVEADYRFRPVSPTPAVAAPFGNGAGALDSTASSRRVSH